VTIKVDFGLPGLGARPGDHICALYFGDAERDGIMLPFLRAGLRAGDKCVCIVDGAAPTDVAARIGDGLDVAGCVASKQLELERAGDVYLASGRFSTTHMIDHLSELMAAATESGGYRCVRAVGEMSWVLSGPPGADELFRYESEINRFSGRYPQVLLCMYDLDRFGGSFLLDMLRTHPWILLGGLIMDNPHYLSPDESHATRP
jgi:DcmR-like sensory protein